MIFPSQLANLSYKFWTLLYSTVYSYAPIHVYSSSDNPGQKYMGQHPRAPISMLKFVKFWIFFGWDNIELGGGGFRKTNESVLAVANFVRKCPIIFVQDCLKYCTHMYGRKLRRGKGEKRSIFLFGVFRGWGAFPN